ncbi:MAG TPA: FAD:protein FMN transferase [Streptosporangiaceae bacterium]|nr:FAD:protein FMN transferase [Streptosporangiaceae bacterium]
MTTDPATLDPHRWRRVHTGDTTVAVAQRNALGTTARIVVWPPGHADAALTAVDDVLSALDLQASRFRPDSEISWLHRAHGGLFMLSGGLAEAIRVALTAAAWTGGLADPTIGSALISLGYDRDFAAIEPGRPDPPAAPVPAPGWQSVRLDGPLLRLPAGVLLDLGATAKGLGSDRAVRAVQAATGNTGGALVSLGGDIATGGTPPAGGWPVRVADPPGLPAGPAGAAPAQRVRLTRGAVATSSVTCREWRRAGRVLHHIVDPRTGRPADGPWRMVSVAAASCADANAAATAAIVAGDGAREWLTAAGLPARLVARDGEVSCIGSWPEGEGEPLDPPRGSHVYRGVGPRGGTR